MNLHNVKLIAAYMAMGAMIEKHKEMLELYGQTQFEFIEELIDVAEFAEEVFERHVAIRGEVPGNYDYEVSEPFGRWFATVTLERNGEPPSTAECRRAIEDLAADLFGRYVQ